MVNQKETAVQAQTTIPQQASMNQLQKNEDLIGASVVRFVKGCSAGLVAAVLLQPL